MFDPMRPQCIYNSNAHVVPSTTPSPSLPYNSRPTSMTMEVSHSLSRGQRQLHFLNLPVEIREAIWRSMLQLINQKRESHWFRKPRIEFAALQLTCRQLYREIQTFRPQLLIPFDRYGQFHEALVSELEQNFRVNIKKFRSLTIEFRLDANRNSIKILSKGLQTLQLSLEELHLSFAGTDGYGTNTYLHGCAYMEEPDEVRLLPPSGQIPAHEMINLLYAIMCMRQLRILVISNLNFPLLARVFQNKSRLEYLHITADPRSAVHTINLNMLGILAVPGKSYYPPVKVMQICSNSMYNASSLPSTCATTLEHLTWTIPDPSLNSNMINRRVYESTDQLIRNLALNARNLKTLRICIQGEGLVRRISGNHDLVHALTFSIAMLSTLKDLEIHLMNKTSTLGYSILSSLPSNLERLYISDELVRPRDLYNFVVQNYLSQDPTPVVQQWVDPVEVRLARWSPQRPLALGEDSYSESQSEDSNKDELVKMWVEDGFYTAASLEDNSSWIDCQANLVTTRERLTNLYLPGIIGEDYRRKDYIPLRTGKLKFISYQFRNPEYMCQTTGTGESLTHMLLRLNGRLLDRERNQNLASHGSAETIPPHIHSSTTVDQQYETQHRSEDQHISLLLHELYAVEYEYPRDVKAALDELKASQFTDDERYFGNEDNARNIFEREIPARLQDRPPAQYPCIIDSDSDYDDQCHWMCPEAQVPNLDRFARIKACRGSLARRHGSKDC